MTAYVIDACAAVKWAFEEKYGSEALKFMGERLSLTAPDLILYECSSVVQKKVWLGEMNEETAWQGYELIFQSDSIQLVDSRLLINPAYHLAVGLNHAIYDCYYLALAQKQDAVVVTTDRKFFD